MYNNNNNKENRENKNILSYEKYLINILENQKKSHKLNIAIRILLFAIIVIRLFVIGY